MSCRCWVWVLDQITPTIRYGVADADEPGNDTTPTDESPDTGGEHTETFEPHDAGVQGEGSPDADDDRHPPARKVRRISVVRWVAAAVLAVVLAGAGYEGWLLFQQHQKEVAAAQALDAAKKYILR